MGSTALVHWNTSTLKAQWNSTTNKLIVSEAACPSCVNPPVRIVVTIANVVDANCCTPYGVEDAWIKADLAQYINGEHILEYVSSCSYRKTLTGSLGDYGDVQWYSDEGCTIAGTLDQFDEINFIYTRQQTHATFWIYADGDVLYDAFYLDENLAEGGSCMPEGAKANNFSACEGPPITTYHACGDGTATFT